MTASGSAQLSYRAASARKTLHDRQREDVQSGVSFRRPDLHKHQLGPLPLHRQRQTLVGHFVDRRDGISRAEPRQHVPGDRRGCVKIVARDDDRTAAIAFHLVHVDQRAQRDHFPPLVPDLEQVEVLDPIAVLALRLDGDLPVAAKLVEAVDVERAQEHRQRLIHVFERHAQGVGLGSVDVQVDLWRVGAEPGRTSARPGCVLQSPGQLVGLALQVRQSAAAAVLDHDLEAAGDAEAGDRRGIAHADHRILDSASGTPAAAGP